MPRDAWDVIGQFDAGFIPEAGGLRRSVDDLPQGTYDCEVVDAEVALLPSGTAVLRLGLRPTGQAVVEKTYWLEDQKGVNRLGADLVALGFDADRWTPAFRRSFAGELRAALPRLRGVRFKFTRKNQPKKDKPGEHWPNFYVDGLLSGGPPTPPRDPSTSDPFGWDTPVPAGDGGINEIPF